MEEKKFKKDQLVQLLFAAAIILLSCILTPGDSKDDRATLFGFKTPILCMHRLVFNRPCAGCGLTRSFVNFAHGNFKEAYGYHRLGIPLFILVLLQIPLRLYLIKTGISGFTPLIQKVIIYPGIFCMVALIINWLIFLFKTSSFGT